MNPGAASKTKESFQPKRNIPTGSNPVAALVAGQILLPAHILCACWCMCSATCLQTLQRHALGMQRQCRMHPLSKRITTSACAYASCVPAWQYTQQAGHNSAAMSGPCQRPHAAFSKSTNTRSVWLQKQGQGRGNTITRLSGQDAPAA
jgi:hypothetical protein